MVYRGICTRSPLLNSRAESPSKCSPSHLHWCDRKASDQARDTAGILSQTPELFKCVARAQDCISDRVTAKWQLVTSGHVRKAPTEPLWIPTQELSKLLKAWNLRFPLSFQSVPEHNVNTFQVNTGWRGNRENSVSLEPAKLCPSKVLS